jgi:hypothetical protein
MEQSQVDEFLHTYAPADVQDTVAWLSANGYALVAQNGDSTFGAQFVYEGDTELRITVDRSQWLLDVAPTPGSKMWQYDLLLAARRGLDYGALFPETGARVPGDPLPEQLPAGMSWRETLPDILPWFGGDTVPALVDRALRQRFALMWPDWKMVSE